MLNKSGVRTTSYGAPNQILFNVEHQLSVGCVIPQSMQTSADSDGRKIVKAGTPIKIDMGNLTADASAVTTDPATAESPSGTDMNAVLLHDVDVTAGSANGTALIFGFVNLNRVDGTTAAKLKAGTFGMITFIKA